MTDCECAIEHPKTHQSAEECRAEGPKGLQCSRPAGHDGQHIACGVRQHPIRTWAGVPDD